MKDTPEIIAAKTEVERSRARLLATAQELQEITGTAVLIVIPTRDLAARHLIVKIDEHFFRHVARFLIGVSLAQHLIHDRQTCFVGG